MVWSEHVMTAAERTKEFLKKVTGLGYKSITEWKYAHREQRRNAWLEMQAAKPKARKRIYAKSRGY
jgi:hypothetical protein